MSEKQKEIYIPHSKINEKVTTIEKINGFKIISKNINKLRNNFSLNFSDTVSNDLDLFLAEISKPKLLIKKVFLMYTKLPSFLKETNEQKRIFIENCCSSENYNSIFFYKINKKI